MPIPRHGASVGDPAENLAECRVSAFGRYNALMLEETAPAINPVPILNAVEWKEKRIGFDSECRRKIARNDRVLFDPTGLDAEKPECRLQNRTGQAHAAYRRFEEVRILRFRAHDGFA
jgi:hypothetical protein